MKTPDFESPTTDALRAYSLEGRQGESVPLRTLTRERWDRVYYFPEGTPRTAVNDAVGSNVTGATEGRLPQPGPLLVFVNGETVVEAVYVLPPIALSSVATVRSVEQAIIRVHSKPPPPHVLVLE